LASRLGYDRVSELAAEAHDTGRPLRELVIDKGLLTRDELDAITTPEAVNRLGSPRPEDHA
jgi:aspartate ammonia-lyase